MAQIYNRPINQARPTSDPIGFSNFPNQVFRRCIKNGFEFTLMVVGQSGLGKSTFVNSLFLSEIYDRNSRPPTNVEKPEKTTKIHSKTLAMEEEGVRLNVTFVDTPGFGDHVNNENCWEPIVEYIDEKFADYLNEETKIERQAAIEDHRVHVCLYFIAPGRGLSELDVLAMRALHDRVNIVPVIAKADTLTPSELKQLKTTLLDEFTRLEIKLYEFPAPTQDMNKSKKDIDYRGRIPFAVVGSNDLKENSRNGPSRVRQYIWGTVEVDNLEHNDFLALRDILISQNLMDLIEITREVHYENFRSRQMQKSPKGYISEEDPFTRMEKEQRMKEREMEAAHATKERIFVEKVNERKQRIQDEETRLNELEAKQNADLQAKQQIIEQLHQQIAELRRQQGLNESGSSHSPDGRKAKKSSTLSLFR